MDGWSPPIEAVNYHIWRTCNMRCNFCFATYDSLLDSRFTGGLPPDKARSLVAELRLGGFRKITFAGGEPTLCPWLSEIVAYAKLIGLKTALVSNGSRLTDDLIGELAANLDWIALSIDSISDGVNLRLGRAVGGHRPVSFDSALSIMKEFRRLGVRTKINTVVTRLNFGEYLLPAIMEIKPDRWKIMRILEVTGENDHQFAQLSIPTSDFMKFIALNSPAPPGTQQVVEDNEDMIGSYVMVDPAGRFIDNSSNSYRPSQPILTVGVEAALKEVALDRTVFERRGGAYDW